MLPLMKLPFGRSSDRTEGQGTAAAVERLAQRLDRLIELTERTNELLEERSRVPGRTAQEAPMSPGQQITADTRAVRPVGGRRRRDAAGRTAPRRSRGKRRASASGRRSQAAAVRPLRLHEAIIQVLEKAGSPLSARDIAERIREGGLYEPPRSGHELRAGQVSARVGNATYRARFVRRDGRIWLADRTLP